MDNKQQIYENKLHERFPNAHFTILNFTAQSAPATIKCDDCGLVREFKQASYLLPKQSFCPRCKSEYFQKFKKLCEEFQVEILNYDKVKTNAQLRCLKCGKEFVKMPTNAVQKQSVNCPYCSSKSPAHEYINYQDRIDKQFGKDEYTVLEKDFIGTDKIHIKHKCGFIYSTRINDFLESHGCPHCSGKRSKGVQKIIEVLLKYNIPYEMEYSIPETRQRFDFWLYDSIAVEYQGEQHFYPTYGEEAFEKVKRNDQIKKEYCKKHNIPIVYITYKQIDQIESILTSLKSSTTSPLDVGEN
nr:MAG TPA: restriction enzyme [Caudoviricetes sp.]